MGEITAAHPVYEIAPTLHEPARATMNTCPDSSGELSTLDLPVVLFLLARAHGWHCHEHASMGFNFRKGLALAFDWLVEAPRNSDFVNTSLRSVTASAAGV